MQPTIAGQVLALHDRGYTAKEISLELKSTGLRVSENRVRAVIRQANSRSADSRRLFEIWEMLTEVLAILREIQGMRPEKIAGRMRTVERDLPRRIGERLTESECRETAPGS